VRNEAWILERFLRAAELWADDIVLADQGSTDETRAIASHFAKVRVVENTSPAYDEGARQRLLLDAAREIEGRRFVVALDADEFLTPTWRDADEWRAALEAPPGTVFGFDWVNLLPNARSAYIPGEKIPFAFVDDGSAHSGDRIHSTRIPVADPSRIRDLEQVKVLHLQFTDWRRMKSKQRWYQCWEALNHANKRAVQIYRQYHRMDAFPARETYPIDPAWINRYRAWGIDLTPQDSRQPLWWDQEVLQWILEHGPERFRKLDIWDVPWEEIARQLDRELDPGALSDPRRGIDHGVLRWLARTQDRVDSARTRWLQRMLILIGW
jgi:glycosyltransferase involved in cell wall biosynthesis